MGEPSANSEVRDAPSLIAFITQEVVAQRSVASIIIYREGGIATRYGPDLFLPDGQPLGQPPATTLKTFLGLPHQTGRGGHASAVLRSHFESPRPGSPLTLPPHLHPSHHPPDLHMRPSQMPALCPGSARRTGLAETTPLVNSPRCVGPCLASLTMMDGTTDPLEKLTALH
jgi:hypothetical protein